MFVSRRDVGGTFSLSFLFFCFPSDLHPLWLDRRPVGFAPPLGDDPVLCCRRSAGVASHSVNIRFVSSSISGVPRLCYTPPFPQAYSSPRPPAYPSRPPSPQQDGCSYGCERELNGRMIASHITHLQMCSWVPILSSSYLVFSHEICLY